MGFVRSASPGRGLVASGLKKGSARPFPLNVIFGTFQLEVSKWKNLGPGIEIPPKGLVARLARPEPLKGQGRRQV